jgi:hypothetical protein
VAVDFTNTAIDLLIETLPDLVNDGLVTTDPLYLKRVVRYPLQNDPTTQSFFLTIGPDVEAGFRKQLAALTSLERTKLGPIPDYEIGGDFLMVNWFKLEGWTPKRRNPQDNYHLAGGSLRAVERAMQRLVREGFFAQLTTDDGNESTQDMENTFNTLDRGFSPIGGENERYNKMWFNFALFSGVANEFWS